MELAGNAVRSWGVLDGVTAAYNLGRCIVIWPVTVLRSRVISLNRHQLCLYLEPQDI